MKQGISSMSGPRNIPALDRILTQERGNVFQRLSELSSFLSLLSFLLFLSFNDHSKLSAVGPESLN
jgi:hypothetical protein